MPVGQKVSPSDRMAGDSGKIHIENLNTSGRTPASRGGRDTHDSIGGGGPRDSGQALSQDKTIGSPPASRSSRDTQDSRKGGTLGDAGKRFSQENRIGAKLPKGA